jgi:N-acetylneuraminate synthase
MREKAFVIAEIGVNFYDTAAKENITLLDAAKKYISSAKQIGIDAVKFQSYKADTLASKDSPAYWDISKEPTATQFELFQKFDNFGRDDYAILSEYCRSIGIKFLSTPFDVESADYLNDMMDIYKISSSDISNIPFIRHIAKKEKPIFLSVGASYLSEVDEAVREIRKITTAKICLLHCVLSYPCKYNDANLKIIKTLRTVFPNLSIGYSDHTPPDSTMTVLSTAYLFGAEVIEKHFTLDKTLQGNDHYHAGDMDDFSKAIQNFELIRLIEGQEEKSVLSCEEIPRREARRSLVLTRDIKKGEILKQTDLIAKRPGTGISPKNIEFVIGRSVKCDLPEDSILTWTII